MSTVQLTFTVERKRLIDIVADDIDIIVSKRVAALRTAKRQNDRRAAGITGTLDQAIQQVVRASARVDAAHNTRDERPSITALISAASKLRRIVEASKGI